MYKCLDCGNENKFYGMVKEQGNALIYQNTRCSSEPVPQRQFAAASAVDSPAPGEGGHTIRGRLWAIQDNGEKDEFTWAYLASEGSWRGFHEVRSCAVCHSTRIMVV